MYCNKFFKTEEEAKAFKKSHGGALYKGVKGEPHPASVPGRSDDGRAGRLAPQHRGGRVSVLRCMEWRAVVGRKGDLSHESAISIHFC